MLQAWISLLRQITQALTTMALKGTDCLCSYVAAAMVSALQLHICLVLPEAGTSNGSRFERRFCSFGIWCDCSLPSNCHNAICSAVLGLLSESKLPADVKDLLVLAVVYNSKIYASGITFARRMKGWRKRYLRFKAANFLFMRVLFRSPEKETFAKGGTAC